MIEQVSVVFTLQNLSCEKCLPGSLVRCYSSCTIKQFENALWGFISWKRLHIARCMSSVCGKKYDSFTYFEWRVLKMYFHSSVSIWYCRKSLNSWSKENVISGLLNHNCISDFHSKKNWKIKFSVILWKSGHFFQAQCCIVLCIQ